MVDQKISQFPSAPVVEYSDLIPLVSVLDGVLTTTKTDLDRAIPDATNTIKGKVKLAGDLGGTASLPLVPGLLSKAPLDSPNFTGSPSAPTPSAGSSNNSVATTAFVSSAIASKASLSSPSFNGTVQVPNSNPGDSSFRAANTGFVSVAVSTAIANIPPVQFTPIENINGQIEAASIKSYILDLSSTYRYNIQSISIKCLSGSCVARLLYTTSAGNQTSSNINVNQTLSVINFNPFRETTLGSSLVLIIDSNNAAQDVIFNVKTQRL